MQRRRPLLCIVNAFVVLFSLTQYASLAKQALQPVSRSVRVHRPAADTSAPLKAEDPDAENFLSKDANKGSADDLIDTPAKENEIKDNGNSDQPDAATRGSRKQPLRKIAKRPAEMHYLSSISPEGGFPILVEASNRVADLKEAVSAGLPLAVVENANDDSGAEEDIGATDEGVEAAQRTSNDEVSTAFVATDSDRKVTDEDGPVAADAAHSEQEDEGLGLDSESLLGDDDTFMDNRDDESSLGAAGEVAVRGDRSDGVVGSPLLSLSAGERLSSVKTLTSHP